MLIPTRRTDKAGATLLAACLFAVTLAASGADAVPVPTTGVRLASATTGGVPDGASGDAGLGGPGGVASTPIGATQWVVYESAGDNIVAGDTNEAADVFVTDGTTTVRLSVLADGTEFDLGLNSYDPDICDSGRKVVFTTDADVAPSDFNGAADVYVVDRDADGDDIFDEYSETGGVSLDIVSVSWDNFFQDYITGFNGAGSGVISGDCTKVAFVSDYEFDVDDFNFSADVYYRDLSFPQRPARWISDSAEIGGLGGGYLPAIGSNGAVITYTTDSFDNVSAAGETGGVIQWDRATDTASYVTVQPDGSPSTGLADTSRPAAMTPNGKCVAFKSNDGFDLLPGATGPGEGVFLWDNRGDAPVVSLVSVDADGFPATNASAPQLSNDCRFVGFQSTDEFLVADDTNRRTDVFVHDTTTSSVGLVSRTAVGSPASGDSNIAGLLYDTATSTGQVLIVSTAAQIGGADGGGAQIDLFRVGFANASLPGAPTGLVATARNASARLTWSAPASTGGSNISAYRVQRSTNGTSWTTVTSSAPTSRTFDVTGLTNGTRYFLRVAAITLAGVGPTTPAVTVTPRTTPGAPTAVTAKAGSKRVTLTWKAPTATGGAPITAYRVQRSKNGRTWTTVTSSAPTTRTFTVTGLRAGTKVWFRVAAINAAGTGANSTKIAATPKR